MGEDGLIRIEKREGIAVVTVDRPEKLNALNAAVVEALGSAFESLRDDDAVGGVIVTGAGEKAFVAGADIHELSEMDPLDGVSRSREGQEVLLAIERFPKPVVAAVNGYALGGGCELALACHLRVASEQAVFGLPEVSLGIIPGYGGTVRLSRLVGLGRAVEMVLTGKRIGAEEAGTIGLVNDVVPHERVLDRAGELLRTILENGPVAVRMALEALYEGIDQGTREALAGEARLFGLLASTEDMREGMSAFLEKRDADFRGR